MTGPFTGVKYTCICTPDHCYGDIFAESPQGLCLLCHYDWRAFEQCPERDEVDR